MSEGFYGQTMRNPHKPDALISVEEWEACLRQDELQRANMVNDYALRIKGALLAEGYDPALFIDLQPSLALAALILKVK